MDKLNLGCKVTTFSTKCKIVFFIVSMPIVFVTFMIGFAVGMDSLF